MMKKSPIVGLVLLASLTGCTPVNGAVVDPLLDELLTAGINEDAASQCAFSSPAPASRVLLGSAQIERDRLNVLVSSSPGSFPGALDAFPVRPEEPIDVCLYEDPAVEDPNVFALAVYDPTGTQDREGGVTILNFWPRALIDERRGG